jgi:hypothetical protein
MIARMLPGFKPRPNKDVCPYCGATTYITKAGYWYKHRQPPMQGMPFGMLVPMGPVCPLSKRTATK